MRQQTWLLGIVGLLTAFLMSSCAAFEDPSKRATANAEDTAVAATLSVVEFQNETMVALRATADTGVALSQQLTQSANNPASTPVNNTNSTTGSSVFGTAAPAVDGGNPIGTVPTPTFTLPAITPTVDTGAGTVETVYSRATIASSLDDAYCALNNVDTFDLTNMETVYFVVYVQNLQPGVSFSLRIENLAGGLAAVDQNFWTSDGEYDSTCVYYGIDSQTMGGEFLAGSFNAILQADGQNVINAEFYIMGNATDNMVE